MRLDLVAITAAVVFSQGTDAFFWLFGPKPWIPLNIPIAAPNPCMIDRNKLNADIAACTGSTTSFGTRPVYDSNGNRVDCA